MIVSIENGTWEIMTGNVDGMILRDPRHAFSLAQVIRRLYEDEPFRTSLSEKAAETSRQFSWEGNARELATIFDEIIARKSRPTGQTLTQAL